MRYIQYTTLTKLYHALHPYTVSPPPARSNIEMNPSITRDSTAVEQYVSRDRSQLEESKEGEVTQENGTYCRAVYTEYKLGLSCIVCCIVGYISSPNYD